MSFINNNHGVFSEKKIALQFFEKDTISHKFYLRFLRMTKVGVISYLIPNSLSKR